MLDPAGFRPRVHPYWSDRYGTKILELAAWRILSSSFYIMWQELGEERRVGVLKELSCILIELFLTDTCCRLNHGAPEDIYAPIPRFCESYLIWQKRTLSV